MTTLAVCLLTRDRPEYAAQAIASLLKALRPGMTLTVSDSSARNDTEMLLEGKTELNYVRRAPQLSAVGHVSAVINECRAQYMIIFHDDDIALPNFLSEMLEAISSRKDIVAAACNAKIMYEGRLSNRRMMGWFREPKLITRKSDVLAQYFRFGCIEPPPFPSYIYKTQALQEVGALETCGKYSDVCILSELTEHGQIYWDSRCLMHYRFHGKNDGRIQSLRDKLRLLRYAKSLDVFKSKSPEIRDYRLRMHLQALLSGNRLYKKSLLGWSNRKIGFFLARTIFSPSCVCRVLLFFASRRFGLKI